MFIQTITCSLKLSASVLTVYAVISVLQSVQLKDIGMQTPTVSPSGQSVGSANSSCTSSGATELLSSPPDLTITNGYMRHFFRSGTSVWNTAALFYAIFELIHLAKDKWVQSSCRSTRVAFTRFNCSSPIILNSVHNFTNDHFDLQHNSSTPQTTTLPATNNSWGGN